MITVLMSKDIRDRKPKVVGPFTERQIVCIILACAYGIPLMFFLPFQDFTINIMIGVLAMAPVIACGWAKIYGMPLEKFFLRCVWPLLVQPRGRKYKTVNTMEKMAPKKKVIKRVKRSKAYKAYK